MRTGHRTAPQARRQRRRRPRRGGRRGALGTHDFPETRLRRGTDAQPLERNPWRRPVPPRPGDAGRGRRTGTAAARCIVTRPVEGPPTAGPGPVGEPECPACRSPLNGRFCERCGHDFASKPVPAPASAPAERAAARLVVPRRGGRPGLLRGGARAERAGHRHGQLPAVLPAAAVPAARSRALVGGVAPGGAPTRKST